MGNVKDITGMVINEWTVIREAGRNKSGGAMYLCRCSCGIERLVEGRSVRVGTSKNCGHDRIAKMQVARSKSERNHGGKKERLYGVWSGMKDRCNNKRSRFYHRYGGRGITLCEEWDKSYENFRDWAYKNGYDDSLPKGQCTIERIDNNVGYSPENCVWATSKTQCNNRSNNHLIEYKGQTHTITEWAEITGIRKDTLRRRICVYNWSIERALTEPSKRNK